MLTISFVNDSSYDLEKKNNLKKALQQELRYVEYGEVDVIFDIISPTPTIGKIDILIFISIDNKKGNYYKTYPNKSYLYSLVIGLKKFEIDDVINADNQVLYNEEGSWNYVDEITSECKAFDTFCYSIHKDIRYFKSAFFYYIKANNCKKSFSNEYIYFNRDIGIKDLLNSACNRCHSDKLNGGFSFAFSNSFDIHKFIPHFIAEAEAKTKQGILTRKKMNLISKDSDLINRLNDSIGTRLCVLNGNAGSGKTLSLMRVAYKTLSHEYDIEGKKRSHNVRFLTYNNMLVYDIKNVLRSMGYFSSNNLSVQTLHKFFFDMFKKTSVVYANYSESMMNRIEELMDLCKERIEIVNRLLRKSFKELNKKERTPFLQLEALQSKRAKDNITSPSSDNDTDEIGEADKKETFQYLSFLVKEQLWDALESPGNLDRAKDQYLKVKKSKAIDNYLNEVFLTDYESILKDLYYFIENPKDFADKHNIKSKRAFFEFIFNTDNLEQDYSADIEDSVNIIKNKVNWSQVFLIDEAQDCSIWEKALLYRTRGSENIVIATGGKDQLIRRSQENDWSVLFGQPIGKETFTLRRTNQRQKANLVKFLNAYASHFELNSKKINPLPETEDKGRVIIDLRLNKEGQISKEYVSSLWNQGLDYGCSNYESLMVLLPHIGFTQSSKDPDTAFSEEMIIDETDTMTITKKAKRGLLDFGFDTFEGTKNMRICDCTINYKSDLNPGQSDTRFLFYDSCRGLEAWNVMCINADEFYREKYVSDEAKLYASTQGGFIQEYSDTFQTHYAAIWCYMAFTRPMDTLYISLKDLTSKFSKSLLEIAKTCGDAVEIIK